MQDEVANADMPKRILFIKQPAAENCQNRQFFMLSGHDRLDSEEMLECHDTVWYNDDITVTAALCLYCDFSPGWK